VVARVFFLPFALETIVPEKIGIRVYRSSISHHAVSYSCLLSFILRVRAGASRMKVLQFAGLRGLHCELPGEQLTAIGVETSSADLDTLAVFWVPLFFTLNNGLCWRPLGHRGSMRLRCTGQAAVVGAAALLAHAIFGVCS